MHKRSLQEQQRILPTPVSGGMFLFNVTCQNGLLKVSFNCVLMEITWLGAICEYANWNVCIPCSRLCFLSHVCLLGHSPITSCTCREQCLWSSPLAAAELHMEVGLHPAEKPSSWRCWTLNHWQQRASSFVSCTTSGMLWDALSLIIQPNYI